MKQIERNVRLESHNLLLKLRPAGSRRRRELLPPELNMNSNSRRREPPEKLELPNSVLRRRPEELSGKLDVLLSSSKLKSVLKKNALLVRPELPPPKKKLS